MILPAVFLVLAIDRCGASVDFSFSTLYDIEDFKGQNEVRIDRCNYGCVIFASTMGGPPENDVYSYNLIIHDKMQDRNYSVSDLSRNFEDKSFKKIPLIVDGQASISILNVNSPDDKAWPIALYVVEKAKAAEFAYDVYDSNNMHGVTVNPNSITTVMSIRPFNLVAKRSGMQNGLTARLTGFENVRDNNKDGCPTAYSTPSQKEFPGFNFNIAGPLISLLFKERNSVQIDASFDFTPTLDLGSNGFISSGGYNGCRKSQSGGIQSFRSMFIEKSDEYSLDSNNHKYRVTIDVDPNLDDDHNVIITDVAPYDKKIVNGYKPVTIAFEKTDFVKIEFINLAGDQGFLLRYSAEVVTDVPGTTSVPVSASSASIASSSSTPLTATTSGSRGIDSMLMLAFTLLAAARMF